MTFTILDTGTLDATDAVGSADHLTGNICATSFDIGASGFYEREVDISGDTLALEGTVDQLQNVNVDNGQLVKLDDDLVCFGWWDKTGHNTLYAAGKTSSTKSSNASVAPTFSDGRTLRVAPVTTARSLFICTNPGVGAYDLVGFVVDVSGSTCTFNSETTLLNNYTGDAEALAACNFSSGNVCVITDLLDTGTGKDGMFASLVSVSGTTPSYDDDAVIISGNGGNTGDARVVNIASDSCVVFYNDGASTNLRAAKVARSGATVSVSNITTLFADTTHTIKDAKFLDTDLCAILYQDSAGTATYVRSVDVSGTPSLNSDELEIVSGSGTSGQELAVVSSSRLIATYNSSHDVALLSYAAAAAADELRHLGLDSDQTNLYVSEVCNGTLQFIHYDLSTLTAQGTSSFGTAAYADIDTQTYGVYPVAKPNEEQVVYLRGRDGNDVQVQYNNLDGTLGWVDVGPGTATWATDKFAVALTPDPLQSNDVTVAFSDDDIYQTTQGTQNWTKMGDASTGLRAGMRFATANNEHLVGGTAGGSVFYTPNWGVSFSDVSGTALGTINWIEESR